jgi:hypothetical protein
MPRRTMRRTPKRRMYGGMPADVNAPYDIGNFAVSQQQAGSSMAGSPNTDIITQAGGRSKRRGRGRRHRGGSGILSPADIGGSTGLLSTGDTPEQKGGYFPKLLKSALAPFGLMGLNKYSKDNSYRKRSRLSNRLRSHRKRR